MKRRHVAALVAVILFVEAAPAPSQTIKITPAAAAASRQMVFYKPSGPYRITNYTVRELVRFAYSLPDTHIFGLPAWTDSDRFDIEYPFESEPTAVEVQDLVRNLLALQFSLTTHVGTRDFPGYALVRAGARLGPQLRPSSADCTRAPLTGVVGVTPCQLRLGEQGIYGIGITMAQFTSELSGSGYVRLPRPVVDRTGLTGTFDLEFSLIRLDRTLRQQAGGGVTITSVRSSRPLEEILELELGLKLQEANVPADVLIVDRVTPPAQPALPRIQQRRILASQAPQAAPAAQATFEVASIKPNNSGVPKVSVQIQPGGRFNVFNQTLRGIIRFAYRLQDFQLVGPGWIDSDRFDITATAGREVMPNEIALMVRALLAERFKLTVRTETRDSPIFALVLARSDGRLGPQMKPAVEDNCTKPVPGQPPTPNMPPICGGFLFGRGGLSGRSVTPAALAGNFSNQVGRLVVDRTGLTGIYDIELQFAGGRGVGLGPLPPQPGEPPTPPDPDRPELSTAIQEQLGLRLESARGPIEVMVIETVERPTPD